LKFVFKFLYEAERTPDKKPRRKRGPLRWILVWGLGRTLNLFSEVSGG